MINQTPKEKIMQIGKRKLVLDHLIVQKMDDEDGPGDDMQSIITYGAKALFDSNADEQTIICELPLNRLFSCNR
jgi:chromodomain-helicase-DNA-binding protein 4